MRKKPKHRHICLNLPLKTIDKAQQIKKKYGIFMGELFEILLDNFKEEKEGERLKVYLKKKRNKNSRMFFSEEARKIMKNKLGRKLREGEVVHHKDGDYLNSSIENLQLFKNKKEHMLVGHNIRYRK